MSVATRWDQYTTYANFQPLFFLITDYVNQVENGNIDSSLDAHRKSLKASVRSQWDQELFVSVKIFSFYLLIQSF
jgi:hypothetical protein